MPQKKSTMSKEAELNVFNPLLLSKCDEEGFIQLTCFKESIYNKYTTHLCYRVDTVHRK